MNALLNGLEACDPTITKFCASFLGRQPTHDCINVEMPDNLTTLGKIRHINDLMCSGKIPAGTSKIMIITLKT